MYTNVVCLLDTKETLLKGMSPYGVSKIYVKFLKTSSITLPSDQCTGANISLKIPLSSCGPTSFQVEHSTNFLCIHKSI